MSADSGGWQGLRAVLRHMLDSDGWYAGWEGGCKKDPGLTLFERVPLTHEEHMALMLEPHPNDTLFHEGA
jgi:hypothetical protein